MILTPILRAALASTLDRFTSGLSDRFSRAVFGRMIRATSPVGASPRRGSRRKGCEKALDEPIDWIKDKFTQN
jgi:hypothetical protein